MTGRSKDRVPSPVGAARGLVGFVLVGAATLVGGCGEPPEACRQLTACCAAIAAEGTDGVWQPSGCSEQENADACASHFARLSQARNARVETWIEGGREGARPQLPSACFEGFE